MNSHRGACAAALYTALTFLAGCATPAGDQDIRVQLCEAPRPQVCTMDYRPVCGNLADGTRTTYSNGCGACADAAVVSWSEGACPE